MSFQGIGELSGRYLISGAGRLKTPLLIVAMSRGQLFLGELVPIRARFRFAWVNHKPDLTTARQLALNGP